MTIPLMAAFYIKLDPGLMPAVGSAAMLIPLVVLPVVSLLTEKLPEKHLNEVFGTGTTKKIRLVNNKKVEQV